MLLTKDILKQEIDYVHDDYIGILYSVIKAFEYPAPRPPSRLPTSQQQWEDFLDECVGCLADAPINRGDQGTYEHRIALQ